ncbi:MAG: diguanylate cyclase, partial [Chloroflexi bacterium]|nr:diguanylate cyclase [Chloroflexota bacterium]
RDVPGARLLTLLLAAICEWTLAAALEAAVVETQAKIFFSQVEYLGAVSAAPLMLLFILAYIRSLPNLPRGFLIGLWGIPVLILGLVWTNPWHGLVWPGFSEGDRAANVLIYHHGPAFWLMVGYIYLLFFFILLILVHQYLWSSYASRVQIGVMLLGSIFSLGAALVYVLNLNPVPGLDWSPVGAAASALILAWSVFRLGLFDLVPVARDKVLEQLQDGVVVIDVEGRILDINQTARRLLGFPAHFSRGAAPGQPMRAGIQALREKAQHGPVELLIDPDQPCYIELQMSTLYGSPGTPAGSLLILRDVTRNKMAELGLQQMNFHLKEQIKEINRLQVQLREQATHDALTGLYNRRYLDETLAFELEQARKDGYPVSVLMLDIDHFKVVNDRFGHPFGDHILQGVGQMLHQYIRVSDVVCRLGGEEFIVVMPHMAPKAAFQRADWLRRECERLVFYCEDLPVSVTLSGGVAAFPQHGDSTEELLRLSDRALYQAKSQGRNRIVLPRAI